MLTAQRRLFTVDDFFFAEGHSALCLLQQEQGKKGGSTFAQLYSILSVDGWKLFFVFFF